MSKFVKSENLDKETLKRLFLWSKQLPIQAAAAKIFAESLANVFVGLKNV